MAKRRRGYKKSACIEPFNTMLDLAGALTLGLYTKHRIKKDFEKGEGVESAQAAGMVFGIESMRGGSRGIINLGGLLGLNSALRDIDEKRGAQCIPCDPPFADKAFGIPTAKKPRGEKYIWRNYCEDGSLYDINPSDYETADEYSDALDEAKQNASVNSGVGQESSVSSSDHQDAARKKYVWRKYCENGSAYGIDPMDFETADDYEEALSEVKGGRN